MGPGLPANVLIEEVTSVRGLGWVKPAELGAGKGIHCRPKWERVPIAHAGRVPSETPAGTPDWIDPLVRHWTFGQRRYHRRSIFMSGAFLRVVTNIKTFNRRDLVRVA